MYIILGVSPIEHFKYRSQFLKDYTAICRLSRQGQGSEVDEAQRGASRERAVDHQSVCHARHGHVRRGVYLHVTAERCGADDDVVAWL